MKANLLLNLLSAGRVKSSARRYVYFFFKHATLRKIFNFLLIEWQKRFKSLNLRGYPYFLKVEPTNVCNFRCPSCFSGSGNDPRQKGFMDFSVYKKIIDELSGYLFAVSLYSWGEPLLHPEIYKMIRYASEKNISTCVSTNFSVFSPESAEMMLESKLEHLIICLDGTDQKTYDNYRKGGDFASLIKNMRLLSEIKKSRKSRLPFVEVQFVVFDYNRHQVEEARQLVKDFSFERFTAKDDGFSPEGHKKIGKENIRFTHELCVWPWSIAYMNYNGDVCSCCGRNAVTTSLGNIKENTFKEIYNNDLFVLCRRLCRGEKSVGGALPCAKCMVAKYYKNS